MNNNNSPQPYFLGGSIKAFISLQACFGFLINEHEKANRLLRVFTNIARALHIIKSI